MRAKHCPLCHQPYPEVRLGVCLPPLKARIFDAISRAGADGIDGAAIIEDLALPSARRR